MHCLLNAGMGALSAVKEIDDGAPLPAEGIDRIRLMIYLRENTFSDKEAMTLSINELNRSEEIKNMSGYFVEGRFEQGDERLTTMYLLTNHQNSLDYYALSLAFHKAGLMEEPGKWREMLVEKKAPARRAR